MRGTAFLLLCAGALAGCGLGLRSPDLFLLTRQGQGSRITLLVNDGGTIRCDGGSARPLPGQLLLEARQLASDLDKEAAAGLRVPSTAASVYSYTIKLQSGTVFFADTAANKHPELARAELFAVHAEQSPCGLHH